MATAPSMRSGGARVYSQSGDIDQLLEDVWVPESLRRGREQTSNSSYQIQPEPQTTEKERILMAELEEARRQLQELGRLPGVQEKQNQGRYGHDGGRDGYGGGDRQNRAWNSNMGGSSHTRNDNSYQKDSWDNSCGSSSGSRSTPTHSDGELLEPLYVNTEEIAASVAAASAPMPPPRTRLPPSAMTAPLSTPIGTGRGIDASSYPVQEAKVATTVGPIQSCQHQHSNEKASSSKHEKSFEMKERFSVFQAFPPLTSTSGRSLPRQRSAPPLQPQSPLQPTFLQQQMVSSPHRDGLSRNFASQAHNGGGMSPGDGVFHFPPQAQQSAISQSSWHNHSKNHGVTSTSRGQVSAASSSSANHQASSQRSEQYHSHSSEHPYAPVSHPPSSQRLIGQERSNSSAANRTEHQHSSHQAYRSESSHASSNVHSTTQQQRKEAASSSERQSQGASDIYSETSSLKPIGVGIHTLRSHTALHKLRQTNSGFQIGTSRLKTLNHSTPQLDQTPPAAAFRSDQQLAAPPQQPIGIGQLRAATLQASAMEPRNSFMRASLSSRQQQMQQQQQQQQQQYNSPGSFTPTWRFSGNGGGGSNAGFDYDTPPSPGGLLRFETDTSRFWYMPNISREDAISFLRPLPPGRFVVRDSTSFPGFYGLAMKVAEVPPGTDASDNPTDLVRHFLIEQTTKGVRIHGCTNEPVFASLAALIYQHTVMPLALPCKLTLPETTDTADSTVDMAVAAAAGSVDPRAILEHGAACNVLYLGATDIESLSGSGGLSRAVDNLLKNRDRLRTCICQLKVAKDGIALMDIGRQQFFRKHYPTACVLHCGMDPQQRCYESEDTKSKGMYNSKIFGFVARKNPGSQENTAVVMCEIEANQPAEAVVRFVSKYLIGRR